MRRSCLVDSYTHPYRRAVSKALDVLAPMVVSEDRHAKQSHLRAKHRLEISLDLFWLQIRHRVLPFWNRASRLRLSDQPIILSPLWSLRHEAALQILRRVR